MLDSDASRKAGRQLIRHRHVEVNGRTVDIPSYLVTPGEEVRIRGFDADRAYFFMRRNALETPEDTADYLDGRGRRGLSSYLEHGYIPLEDPVLEAFHQGEQVSRTLEYAFDDFAVAQMAGALGRDEDRRLFLERAGNWRNVFDPETRLVRGRHADGSWITPFDATERVDYITEGSSWHYSWFVPHDVAALMESMGGRSTFVARLDSLFEHGLYWHGNEPSHHIPYLYAYAGQPWKVQQRVREVMQAEYDDGPGGGGSVLAVSTVTMQISYPQPPQPLSPEDGARVDAAYPTFQWQPVVASFPVSPVLYRLVIKRVQGTQTPEQAIRSEPVWHEDVVRDVTSYVYPVQALPLEHGQRYAWQVEALDADEAPLAPEYRSEVASFVHHDPKQEAASAAVVLRSPARTPAARLPVDKAVPITFTLDPPYDPDRASWQDVEVWILRDWSDAVQKEPLAWFAGLAGEG